MRSPYFPSVENEILHAGIGVLIVNILAAELNLVTNAVNR